MNMQWKVVDENYLNYLRSFDSRIPHSNYGADKYKPFFGVLFDLDDDISYITQISHPQKRHYKMKNSKDFKKVFANNRLIGVVNLNYMFPIPKELMIDLKYKDIDLYRTFQSDIEKSKYINLLKTEISVMNKMGLDVAASSVYNERLNYPNSILSKRCLDFESMNELCRQYINKGQAK
ncbi:MAG: type III toxin-antitoxin system ToxN/AbiQ family toxin [Anaerovoracaceae bacterium]